MKLNIPTKKSKYFIEVYKENCPLFGNVLSELEMEIATKQLKPQHIEESFQQKCFEIWPDVVFPFRNTKNDYGTYDKSICLSVNDTVAHGNYKDIDFFNIGDVISIDCGIALLVKSRIEMQRLNLDSAFTTIYGKKHLLKSNKKGLIDTNLASLALLNNSAQKNTADISSIIQETAFDYGYGLVSALVGHGIGINLHEAPKIHNARGQFSPCTLFDGLVLCVEPIYTLGEGITKVFVDSDGWTIKTVDKTISSHFETMYLVEDGKLIDLVGISNWII